MNRLKWVGIVFLLVILMGCATAFPLLRDAELNKIVQSHIARWGEYTYMEIKLADDCSGYVAFLWILPEGRRAIVLSQFNGKWVVEERQE